MSGGVFRIRNVQIGMRTTFEDHNEHFAECIYDFRVCVYALENQRRCILLLVSSSRVVVVVVQQQQYKESWQVGSQYIKREKSLMYSYIVLCCMCVRYYVYRPCTSLLRLLQARRRRPDGRRCWDGGALRKNALQKKNCNKKKLHTREIA